MNQRSPTIQNRRVNYSVLFVPIFSISINCIYKTPLLPCLSILSSILLWAYPPYFNQMPKALLRIVRLTILYTIDEFCMNSTRNYRVRVERYKYITNLIKWVRLELTYIVLYIPMPWRGSNLTYDIGLTIFYTIGEFDMNSAWNYRVRVEGSKYLTI